MNRYILVFLLIFCVSNSYAGGSNPEDNFASRSIFLQIIISTFNSVVPAVRQGLNNLLGRADNNGGGELAAASDATGQSLSAEPELTNGLQIGARSAQRLVSESSFRGDRGSQSPLSSIEARDANQGDNVNKKRSRDGEASSEEQPPKKMQRINEGMSPFSSSESAFGGARQEITMDDLRQRARVAGMVFGKTWRKLAEQNSQEELNLPEINFSYVRSLFLNNWCKWHKNGICSETIQIENNNQDAVINEYCKEYIRYYEKSIARIKPDIFKTPIDDEDGLRANRGNQSSSSSSSESAFVGARQGLTMDDLRQRARAAGMVCGKARRKLAEQNSQEELNLPEMNLRYARFLFFNNWYRWYEDGECSKTIQIENNNQEAVIKAYCEEYIKSHEEAMTRIEFDISKTLMNDKSQSESLANQLSSSSSSCSSSQEVSTIDGPIASERIGEDEESEAQPPTTVNNNGVRNFGRMVEEAHNLGYRHGRHDIDDRDANTRLSAIVQENSLIDSDLSIIKQAYQKGLLQGRNAANRNS